MNEAILSSAVATLTKKTKRKDGTFKIVDADWILFRREEALRDRDYELYILLTKTYNKQKD